MDLSIVVAVFNEEENMKPLIDQIHKALHGVFSYEIIVVNDGSTDKTKQEVVGLQDDLVQLIEFRKNYGQSSALAAGIDAAQGSFIVTMDGDLQNDPSDISKLYHKLINEDLDVVTGIRENRQDHYFLRKIPSWLANNLIRKSTGLDLKDNGCALKIFRAEILKEIGLYGELHRFVTLLAYFEGAKIDQMLVKHHARKFGESKYGLGRTFKVLSDLLLVLFFKKYLQKPMHLFGKWGGITFAFGAVINFYLLYLKVGLQEDIWGKPLMLLGLMLTLGGIQLVTIGLVLDLQMRTYYESQNKKPYKIRNVYQGDKKI